MDRLYRLTASLQNQKHKIQSNIFENISEVADYWQKDTENVHQLTEIAIFIATPREKHLSVYFTSG